MISYAHSHIAWTQVKAEIGSNIIRCNARKILEVGAGANPLFTKEFIDEHGLDYTALDISAAELAKAPDYYNKIVADICADKLEVDQRFDFIFSRMLAEHVPKGEVLHRNVFYLLAPGGRAFHFFPTLYALPFFVNRWLPERLAEALLHAIQPGRELSGKQAKFPAYYSWCRGPTVAQLRRLESVGYEVESYVGFFGHGAYYLKFPWLLGLHNKLTKWLIANPKAWMTSFAQITLKKPQ